MFMGPFDVMKPWSIAGVEGASRFLNKIWDLLQTDPASLKLRESETKSISIKMHQTIKKVTEDIEKFHFNTAISAIMEYVNLLREKVVDSEQWIVNSGNSSNKSKHRTPNTVHQTQSNRFAEWDEALEVLLTLLAPFAPFLAEEIYQRLYSGNFKLSQKFNSIHFQPWPKFNPKFVREEEVTIAVQINGKLRATLNVKTQMSNVKNDVVEAAKADSKIQKWLSGKKIQKIIFVPSKLINLVAS
jgi:leucyl-tRNA synthetase